MNAPVAAVAAHRVTAAPDQHPPRVPFTLCVGVTGHRLDALPELVGQRLEPLARQRRQGVGERAIQPPAGMAWRELDADDLVAPHIRNMGIGFVHSMTSKLAPC